ncbi:MAG: hypothetical protein KAH54_03165 [Candidatus Sabulitectum sp.]|nr:hypothetical protein [Candidatus Sabulitectum sp.]
MRYYSALTLLLFASCAKIVSPSGGPVDDKAPEVVTVLPEPGFVDSIPREVTITFSEKISASEDIVQLYPDLDGEVTINGKEVSVHTGAGEGVVMITLSSSLEDLRGNRIGNPETFVWNSIPEDSFATVSIIVLRDGGGSVTSSARCDFFLLPDTVSPRITHYPDTLSAINAGWLPTGEYRVVCYEDIDQGRSWDPEREPGTEESVVLASGEEVHLSMTMTIIDSIGPRISQVDVVDGWHLEVLWNEQVNVNSAIERSQTVAITGPDSLPVTVFGVKASAGRSSTGRMTVYTEELSDTLYTVVVQGIEDLAGNPSLADTLEFWGSDSLPVTPLAVQSAFPADGGVEVTSSGPFMISFTDWVDEYALDSLYTVRRVSDSTLVAGVLSRTSATAFSFVPDRELLGERQYRIDLLPGLVSLQGDSIPGQSWTFTPAWSDLPGNISGTISGTGASLVTMVVSPAGSGGEVLSEVFAPGEYSFEEIFGGRYTVSVFVDWNQDNIWNPGEPYGAWPGVVEVFPGIETENIDIQVVP